MSEINIIRNIMPSINVINNISTDIDRIFKSINTRGLDGSNIINLRKQIDDIIIKYKLHNLSINIDIRSSNQIQRTYNDLLQFFGLTKLNEENSNTKNIIYSLTNKLTSDKIRFNFIYYTLVTSYKIINQSIGDEMRTQMFFRNILNNIEPNEYISISMNLDLIVFSIIRIKDFVKNSTINSMLNILIYNILLTISLFTPESN